MDKKIPAQEKPVAQEEKVMHSFKDQEVAFTSKNVVVLVAIVLLGVATGFTLSRYTVKTGKSMLPGVVKTSVEKGKIYGSDDTKTFSDTAEGTVKEGGVEGEGQFHLERPGGESQNVYMTSSLVDLSKFIDRKVKVWGQTQKAQTAGWLMDVGRVEVLE